MPFHSISGYHWLVKGVEQFLPRSFRRSWKLKGSGMPQNEGQTGMIDPRCYWRILTPEGVLDRQARGVRSNIIALPRGRKQFEEADSQGMGLHQSIWSDDCRYLCSKIFCRSYDHLHVALESLLKHNGWCRLCKIVERKMNSLLASIMKQWSRRHIIMCESCSSIWRKVFSGLRRLMFPSVMLVFDP